MPEDRLPPMMLGAGILPLALVWFGWSMKTHWVAQVCAAYFLGLGVILIFISGIVYVVDVYPLCASSAVSIHVVFRSVFTASFPLWTGLLYEALGVDWMSTLLAGVAAVLFPFLILFFLYGKKIEAGALTQTRGRARPSTLLGERLALDLCNGSISVWLVHLITSF